MTASANRIARKRSDLAISHEEGGRLVYPDDPRPGRAKRSGREQVLALLIAIGVAIVVTLFGGVFLYVARMMQ